ncbi:DUF3482 domain-containing protein [Hahella ganghwensis]|uniref:DUF3482 domain-containing protein n=1 Tax=Hahella ganghwensis TaxID=286420 RepID=UPI000370BD77|nr:DUF3482 domain-containing protein [Hahella ganghwensis]
MEPDQVAEMDSRAISVAVVGHTNAGKTSMMRTLLRDAGFGQVAISPGTTRHVEGGSLLIQGEVALKLYDTPGLEDSIGLLEAIENIDFEEGRRRLQLFLEQLPEDTEFDQEAKVIRQLLEDDLIFYVIDCREPVLGKYRDELKIIAMAAKPVIPVLNFIQDDLSQVDAWKHSLADLGLHAVVEFDTVIFNFEDEKRLYQKMQALMASYHDLIQRLIDSRQRQWNEQIRAAQRAIAELMVNVTAYRQGLPSKQASNEVRDSLETKESWENKDSFHRLIRRAEEQSIRTMLNIFGFDEKDVKNEDLPITNGKWELDLFDPVNLKEFGLDAGSNAAKGAAVGVGIDAMTGGLTLGAAAALGAAAGFVWTAGRRYRDEITSKFTGNQFICVDENTLKVLWFRQVVLLKALEHRGHASESGINVAAVSDKKLPANWKNWMHTARQHPKWSSILTQDEEFFTREREKLVEDIVRSLGETGNVGDTVNADT